MINTIIPQDAVCVEATPLTVVAPLLPAERPYIAGAADRRRDEFARGRSCARQALESIGHHHFAVEVGEDREPIWPHGVVGSITHTTDFCAAAVARSVALDGLGIDAESNKPLPQGVGRLTSIEAELEHLEPTPKIAWDTLVFSAKESSYKAVFPLTRRWIGFLDVTIALDADTRTFRVHPATSAANDVVLRISGRYTFDADRIYTSAWIAREDRTAPIARKVYS